MSESQCGFIRKRIEPVSYTHLITATPFANIFIEPDADSNTRNLFPKDFLTVLPTPELYIGADKIFGNGDADNWENEYGF